MASVPSGLGSARRGPVFGWARLGWAELVPAGWAGCKFLATAQTDGSRMGPARSCRHWPNRTLPGPAQWNPAGPGSAEPGCMTLPGMVDLNLAGPGQIL